MDTLTIESVADYVITKDSATKYDGALVIMGYSSGYLPLEFMQRIFKQQPYFVQFMHWLNGTAPYQLVETAKQGLIPMQNSTFFSEEAIIEHHKQKPYFETAYKIIQTTIETKKPPTEVDPQDPVAWCLFCHIKPSSLTTDKDLLKQAWVYYAATNGTESVPEDRAADEYFHRNVELVTKYIKKEQLSLLYYPEADPEVLYTAADMEF